MLARALARAHMRMAIPSLSPWPIETHFSDKLAGNIFAGELQAGDGQITVTDAPGFGASIDQQRLAEFAF
jgi:L-alanine-DL-glutamate epimerase-like enolase superfamily enzyme